ncbi:MAG TPA: EAL domain-containing protein [Mycobacteriales bacterium]|jgi:diguanylate cyclase (GGDEF)-like protein|nr:EAL domain-containing protein [Mycobacteriales bacterium]
MTQERQLSAVLSEFARTMVTDFPIQAILDRLVERIVDVLPVTAAGVTLISPGKNPHYVAASNDAALEFETLQTETGRGPCVVAYQTGVAVSIPDLLTDPRFPEFSAAAAGARVAAVFTFPLRHDDGRLGALDLYRDTPGPLAPDDMAAAQTLADVAAAYLLNAQARQDAREAADRLRASTLHDALTGLPNRVLLQQRLAHAADRARRSHTEAAVLFADLDGFKQVNDTYGHPVGDALLIAVAARLSTLLRPGDTLARVSGDEFVILCEDLRAASDIEELANRIDSAFTTPFVVADGGTTQVEISISASVGMAFSGHAEDITRNLVRDADIAMYQAKRKGGGAHQVIDLTEAHRSADLRALQQDLRAAFSHDALAVSYQPIVRAGSGEVTGVEALLRWTHPSRGAVPAPAMVGIAEESSLIVDIGAWVLDRGCRDHMRWLREHPDTPLDLAVNVSVRQLMGPGFRDTVAAALDRTGMRPSHLILEMTEGMFLDDSARATTVFADLKSLGVRLALDDFGTGYSSLNYLRRFPVDIVKIDQGFVADIGEQHTGSEIVAAVTRLAHALGLSVTAEGVETAAQHDAVVAIGCESAQGFHYAPALTFEELSARLWAHPPGLLHLPAPRRR